MLKAKSIVTLLCSLTLLVACVQENKDNEVDVTVASDEELLYRYGIRYLPNLPELEQQVADYRRRLIAESYLSQLVDSRQTPVSEAECREFYNSAEGNLKLDHTIIKGFYLKMMGNSSKVGTVKAWLGELGEGNTDHVAELDQFCQQRAVDYEEWLDQWTDMQALNEHLPVVISNADQLLHQQVYEMRDAQYVYLILITDYRLKDDSQPYEYAAADIRQLLQWRKNQALREVLMRELRDKCK